MATARTRKDDSDSDDDFFFYGTPLADEAAQTQLPARTAQDPTKTRAAPLHEQVLLGRALRPAARRLRRPQAQAPGTACCAALRPCCAKPPRRPARGSRTPRSTWSAAAHGAAWRCWQLTAPAVVPPLASTPSPQEVTDEQGRRRFHGAFTGGFSAGYFNTVGSKVRGAWPISLARLLACYHCWTHRVQRPLPPSPTAPRLPRRRPAGS